MRTYALLRDLDENVQGESRLTRNKIHNTVAMERVRAKAIG